PQTDALSTELHRHADFCCLSTYCRIQDSNEFVKCFMPKFGTVGCFYSAEAANRPKFRHNPTSYLPSARIDAAPSAASHRQVMAHSSSGLQHSVSWGRR